MTISTLERFVWRPGNLVAVGAFVVKGEEAGHPFRGNQWEAGESGLELTPDERVAVKEWSGAGHAQIQRDARSDNTTSTIEHLDSAIAKSTTTSDQIVYRSLAELPPNMAIGPWTDRGFSSTSTSSPEGTMFENENHMVITVPAGSRALAVAGPYDELLLPRGSVFQIESITTVDKPGFGPRSEIIARLVSAAAKLWRPFVIKGEAEGHPFRGNQYEEGESGPEERHFNLGGVPISKVPRNYVTGAGYSEQSEKSEPYYASNIKGCYTFDVGTGEANDPLRSGQIVLPPPAAEPVLRGSVEWDAYMATFLRVTFGNTAGRRGNLAYRMMDSAIARSTTTRDTVLYRGIAVSDALQYGVGATFRDMGYTSVTRDPALAEQFAELRATGSAEHLGTGLFDENRVLAGGEKIVFAIHVPAGSSTMAGDDSVKEFILPRGGTYTVTSYDPGTGLTHVDYKP